jgi:hypothetical protein
LDAIPEMSVSGSQTEDAQALLRDNIVAVSRNRRIRYYLKKPELKEPDGLQQKRAAFNAYYFTAEEVDAKLNEEALFLSLAAQMGGRLSSSAQTILENEREDALLRRESLVGGKEELLQKGQDSDFKRLLSLYLKTAVNELHIPLRFKLTLFAYAPESLRKTIRQELAAEPNPQPIAEILDAIQARFPG